MAAAVTKFLCLLFLFTLIVGGNCDDPCSGTPLKIEQSATGKLVKNKPEWTVTIVNDCSCNQVDVKLSCKGFETVEDIDTSILSKSGDECVVGRRLDANDHFSFAYAWQPSFPFKILDSTVACS